MKNLNYLTDKKLLKDTAEIAREIRNKTLDLFDHLSEINKRKLFCELGYSSLFKYIVNELKFSESQAAIYNNIIQARVVDLAPVKKMVESGEISLFALGEAAKNIRLEGIQAPQEKLKKIEEFKGLTQREIKTKPSNRIKIELDEKLIFKLQKVKEKFDLNLDLPELIDYLADVALEKEIKTETKTITPKLKRYLIIKSKHQCEYKNSKGTRCQETKFLEIDHIYPKALGGTNHPSNLRVLCRAHNQRAAYEQFGGKTNFKTQIKT